jgi:hypothetical protein
MLIWQELLALLYLVYYLGVVSIGDHMRFKFI